MGVNGKQQACGACLLRLPGSASRRNRARIALALAALLTSAAADPPAWTRTQTPFPIAGPIHYVGSEGIAAYLIRTSRGAILIDATMKANAAMVARNIVATGVRLHDVKLILVTHAHFDHAGALAALERMTGAKVVAGARDVDALERGLPPGETSYGVIRFPAVKVDRGIRDGERVTLGDTTLVARATPGHTPGCTTWTMRIAVKGRGRDVAFPCSVSVAGNRLVGNRRYPGIIDNYRRSIAMLRDLPADIVLPSHPEIADVIGRGRKGTADSFVAPKLLRDIATRAAGDFDAELVRQSKLAGK